MNQTTLLGIERDSTSRTLAHFASRGGYANILQVLLTQGVPVDGQDYNGRTALHEAAFNGQQGSAWMLIDRCGSSAHQEPR